MTLNFWSFCLYLQSTEFTGLCHHTWFVSALRKIKKTMTSQGLKIIFKKERKNNNNKRMLFSLGPFLGSMGRCHLLYLLVCFFWIKTGKASLSLPSLLQPSRPLSWEVREKQNVTSAVPSDSNVRGSHLHPALTHSKRSNSDSLRISGLSLSRSLARWG